MFYVSFHRDSLIYSQAQARCRHSALFAGRLNGASPPRVSQVLQGAVDTPLTQASL